MALHQETLPEPLPPEPLTLVAAWLEQVAAARTQPNPNAMVLATADENGQPLTSRDARQSTIEAVLAALAA